MADALAINGHIIGGDNYASIQLLWENPNPTAAFTPRTITLANTDYDLLLIECFRSTSNQTHTYSEIVEKGKGILLQRPQTTGTTNLQVWAREFTYVSDISLTIQNAYYHLQGSSVEINNALMIPYKIYGLKKVANLIHENLQVSVASVVGAVKVKVLTGITAVVSAANNYVSINYELPSNMTDYLGSIFVCYGVTANWAFTSGQVDMHLYNGSMHDIRFTASVAQSYYGRVLTYYT